MQVYTMNATFLYRIMPYFNSKNTEIKPPSKAVSLVFELHHSLAVSWNRK